MRTFSALLALSLLLLTACTTKQQSPEDLRERTAQATAELKDNAKAVAQGVRDGLRSKNDTTDTGKVDLNSASKVTLTSLPGVTAAEADVIISHRPYSDPHELVTRKLMSQKLYDRLEDKVTASK
ncbi:MAG: helix-hairpin-helix domain-containing protein [Acidobacteriales bacterium]|nr:helix-hairpin-helix domain-containing protein [Terriglobales bacterium]